MTRLIEPLKDGRSKVTEDSGEIWYSLIERGFPDEGYRLFQGVTYPILTQDQIENTVLPYFDALSHSKYPHESDQLFRNLYYSHNLYTRSILERVARLRIAEHLKTISTNEAI